MTLLAWLVFAMIDTSVAWLLSIGLPSLQLAFMRYFGHAVISTTLLCREGIDRQMFETGHLWLVLFRASLLISATAFNFIALQYVPLTITASIMFSAPIITCALAVPMLGERVGPAQIFAIFLGFFGVLIVIRPFGETFHWAALLSFYNAFALALYSILTRKLSGTVSTEVMQFYMGVSGTLVMAPFAWATWISPDTIRDWVLLFALGIWGWGGHELLTRAHGFAGSNTLMPYTYTFLIYLTISSYLVFGHLPDLLGIIGALVIVVSGLLIWHLSRDPKSARS
ncbi:MAG: DMT family transporter [Pseudomonadota bacterium]